MNKTHRAYLTSKCQIALSPTNLRPIGAGPTPLVKINNILEIGVRSATFVIFKLIFEHSLVNQDLGMFNSNVFNNNTLGSIGLARKDPSKI